MKAVIMAGGFGTRLRPMTCNIPKPMVPVINKPMMEHIIALLKTHGITDIVAALFHQPDVITGYFGDGSKFGVNIQYVHAIEDYGTAGGVKNCEEFLKERFLIISGDILTDINISEAIKFHQKKSAKATIVLTHAVNPLQYGVVITNKSDRITKFLEKPSWGEVFSDTINTGIYILDRDILEMIPPKTEMDFSKDLYPKMLTDDQSLFGYVDNGYWRDIGTLNEYQEANLDALSGKVKLTADIRGKNIIGKNVSIASGAKISNSVIGDNCVLEPGAIIRNSVIWDNVYVGTNSEISASIIGRRSSIGEGAVIEENVFIGENCTIGKRTRLFPNIKLWPDKVVEDGANLSTSLVLEDKWLREIFVGARVTGISNIEMNPEFGAKLGSAFGTSIPEGAVIVSSRDSDNVSRMMNRALICGLISSGVTVNDLRATPIPMVRYTLSSGKEAGGFHVRKSPFDKNMTDIIFFDSDGYDLPSARTKKVERFFFGEELRRANFNSVGSINFPERTTESYQQRFLENIDSEIMHNSKFKIVVDYSNGSASAIFPIILGRFNIQVVSLNAYLDPRKLTKDKAEFDHALAQVSYIVTSLGYDLGFLMDAGGEKLFVVDEKGRPINSDRLLILVTKLFLMTHEKTPKIAVPITTSNTIFDIAKEHNVEVVLTKNNHSSVMEAAKDNDVQFVGGTKGGYVFPRFLFATDAMFAAMKILEMIAKAGVRLGDLDKSIPRYYSFKRNMKISWEAKGRIMRRLMEDSVKYKRIMVDGIKMHIDNTPTTVLLIPDMERPLFHINVESANKDAGEKILNEYEDKIMKWAEPQAN